MVFFLFLREAALFFVPRFFVFALRDETYRWYVFTDDFETRFLFLKGTDFFLGDEACLVFTADFEEVSFFFLPEDFLVVFLTGIYMYSIAYNARLLAHHSNDVPYTYYVLLSPDDVW